MSHGMVRHAQHCRRPVTGVALDAANGSVVFAGDSPNDAPMFDFFANSVGVANVRRFAAALHAPPKYVTRAACGSGFAELAEHVLRGR